jgi:valyl-tRNA synthetase
VIEPMLTDQWYVDAATLARPAIEAVRSGDIAVVPETWKKTWFNWLENIQPWCVSRQLWWGHRIPAWFDDAGNVYVAETFEEAQQQAGEGVELRQDEDVLDTWFSSALWPFATLGWPEQTEDLKRHYPNDVLISGFDIIFFWDARMAMQGFEFMGERPWKTLYLHGLVRDAQGQKMSKSKGNAVDPLGLIDKYGADALRFTLAAMESQGRDIKLDERRVEGYRNFATKLWNAARFLQMNGVGASQSIAAPSAELSVNRWIIGEVVETLAKLDKAFAGLRFDDMADAIYHFTWGTFCDWYVELVKGAFDDETKRVAAWAFDQILVMLHPFMPFVTEELWHAMGERPYDLIVAKWPNPSLSVDAHAKDEIQRVIQLTESIRAARNEVNVPPSAVPVLHVYECSKIWHEILTSNAVALRRLARVAVSLEVPVEQFTNDPVSHAADDDAAQRWANSEALHIGLIGIGAAIELGGIIDVNAEKARLSKALEASAKEAQSLAARLANPAFAERAKPEAVEKARADHDARAAEAERLRAALARLG